MSPSLLTFTRYNWDSSTNAEPHLITVTSPRVDNLINDAENYEITVAVDDDNSDISFRNVADITLSGTVKKDVAGFTINPQTFNNIEEGSNEATVSIALNAQPKNTVTLSLSSSHPSDAALSPVELTFATTDWNVFQTITVTSRVDDSVITSDLLFTVTASASSTDTDFDDVRDTIVGVIIDDDKSGELVFDSSSSALVIFEDGPPHNVSVSLNLAPTDDVILTFISSLDLVTVPTTLTFTANNWNIGQTFPVTASASAGLDGVLEGPRDFSIIVSATSSDTNFNIAATLQGRLEDNPCSVFTDAVVIVDLDTSLYQCFITSKFIVLPQTYGGLDSDLYLNNIDEGSNETTFSITPSFQPSNDVTFTITSSHPSDVTLSSAQLIVTPADWSMPQTVTVTSRAEDNSVTGDLTYTVTVSLSSDDGDFDDIGFTFVGNIIDIDKSNELVFDQPSIVITEGGKPLNVAVSLNMAPI